MRGSTVDALWFRRDPMFDRQLDAWSAQLTVQFSTAARSPFAAAEQFALNRGASPTTVFQGSLSAATSPASPPSPAPWSAAYAVRVPLSTPYVYSGGDLCIEISGTPVSAGAQRWWFDYYQADTTAIVQPVGTPCGEPAVHYQRTAMAWHRNLAPGGTISITTVGRARSIGGLAFGPPLASPISLESIGATGCTLHIQPAVIVPTIYPQLASRVATPDSTALQIPAQTNLLGSPFWSQGVNLESGPQSNPAGVTTTNALKFTIASALPAVALTTVRSDAVVIGAPLPDAGRVDLGRGPVMRFDLR